MDKYSTQNDDVFPSLNLHPSYSSDDGSNRTPKFFDRFYDSSSDDDFCPSSCSAAPSTSDGVETAGRRLDYMIQFLERKLSSPDHDRTRALPEFVGKGGGAGMFKVPFRAAVHPGRPPTLEVRPHPLRETQIGCFLRSVVCTESQLWAGLECGVRVWNFADLYGSACGAGGVARSGDEETAPFCESVQTPAAICLVVDAANRVVWGGHKDGKVRAWKMDQCLGDAPFTECLAWQAHRTPVLSLVMTSYGEFQVPKIHCPSGRKILEK